MKLIIAIVNSDDSSSVQAALTEEGYFVTKLSTTGGFLKKGNTTFFIGTNDDKVEYAVGIIKENSKKRVEKEPTVPPTEMGEFFTPIMVDVLVGGATVFVLDIEQFEKF
ncbi:MAG: cyclic-di-AMP receptor [Faecalibacillus intestinalis]|uniref:cyclic-di-AMP receptor n=1 Tax=Faecalibacillus intestinalis TaxID=1982626 RepID=UPI0039928302